MNNHNSFSTYIDLITCKKCNNFFNNPLTQICGHTYCRDCFSISLDVGGLIISICHECGYQNRYQNSLPNINIAVKSLVESYLENVSHLSINDKESQIKCSTCNVLLSTNEVFTCKTCNNLQNLKYSFYCGNCGWTFHRKHSFIQAEFVTKDERDKLMQMLCDVFASIQNNHIKLSKIQNDIILKRNFLTKVFIDSTRDFNSLIEKALEKNDQLKNLSSIKFVKKANIDVISKAVNNYNEVMLFINFLLNDLEKPLIPTQNNCYNLNNLQKIVSNSQYTTEYEPPCKKK